MTQHQDVFFIPPPRVVGGAQGASTPVSTATLGLIHRQDPSLINYIWCFLLLRGKVGRQLEMAILFPPICINPLSILFIYIY